VITQVIIPAAGMGLRLGCAEPKALVEVDGSPLLLRTMRQFSKIAGGKDIIVPIPVECREAFSAALSTVDAPAHVRLVDGGAQRQDSVWNALGELDSDTEVVLIHDAARPFVPESVVQAAAEAAQEYGAATVAVPVVDTILEVDSEEFLEHTPDRNRLWACQTPQAFQVEVIREAHRHAQARHFYGTDDAALVRLMGKPVKIVEGVPRNFKVTTPFDLLMACQIAREGWE